MCRANSFFDFLRIWSVNIFRSEEEGKTRQARMLHEEFDAVLHDFASFKARSDLGLTKLQSTSLIRLSRLELMAHMILI
jgi:hypothetical protein